MSVMCLGDGSHWSATTAEYQKKTIKCQYNFRRQPSYVYYTTGEYIDTRKLQSSPDCIVSENFYMIHL